MKLAQRFARRTSDRAETPTTVVGPARTGARTKELVGRLQPGDIAVIDHKDLDRVAAESLVARGVQAVLNASASSSGRYPNEGPLILLRAGIVLVDEFGGWIMGAIDDLNWVTVTDNQVFLDDQLIATGTRQSIASIERIHEQAEKNLGEEFVRFIENTAGYFDKNRDLLADGLVVPDVDTEFKGRHCLMVVRGHDYLQDLKLLRESGYTAEYRPVYVGVDGGADALREMGMKPDVIVGDFDSVSESTLRCGAELVVHGFLDGRNPGAERLSELGLPYRVFTASGTSEDIAMLLAYQRGADLIVAVGTHTSMVDFLDKGRSGMASTILTRMKVGPILVDARGVSRLYRTGVRKRDLAMLFGGTLLSMVTIASVSEPVRLVIRALWSDLVG